VESASGAVKGADGVVVLMGRLPAEIEYLLDTVDRVPSLRVEDH